MDLVAALAIAALLACVAVPSYRDHVVRAHRSDARAALLALAVAEENFHAACNPTPPPWTTRLESSCSASSVKFPASVAQGSYELGVSSPDANTGPPPRRRSGAALRNGTSIAACCGSAAPAAGPRAGRTAPRTTRNAGAGSDRPIAANVRRSGLRHAPGSQLARQREDHVLHPARDLLGAEPPHSRSRATTRWTSSSGAEAPAVTPTRLAALEPLALRGRRVRRRDSPACRPSRDLAQAVGVGTRRRADHHHHVAAGRPAP